MKPAPLSPRAINLVNSSLRCATPISEDEAAAALMVVGSPLYPAWLHFLTQYGGMKYHVDASASQAQGLYDVCFTPEEDERPLDLRGEITLEETVAPILDLGYYRDAGPFGMGLDAQGRVVWDYEVPVFSTIEKLLESDAVKYELSQRTGEWWWLRGAASSVALQEISCQTDLHVVEAADDHWNRWWVGDEVYVQHFMQWADGERSSQLWIFWCGSPVETMRLRFAACFEGTSSLTRWPFP